VIGSEGERGREGARDTGLSWQRDTGGLVWRGEWRERRREEGREIQRRERG
jgi:hypothetical protein